MSSRAFFRRPAVLLALALCAVAAVVSVLGKLAGGPDSGTKAIDLASPRGSEAYPSFSPDGKRLAYSVRFARDETRHVFIRNLPNGGRWQLTYGEADDVSPAWSPDESRIAFLRVDGDETACMVIPAAGGAAQMISDCAQPAEGNPLPVIAWTPDGKSLAASAPGENRLPAIALIPAGGGAPKRLTAPPDGTLGDSTPAISPDGRTLAFVRHASAEAADLYTCDLDGGQPQRLTFDNRQIHGLAWTPDGSHLIYAGYRMGRWRLWRLAATGGSPRDLGLAKTGAQFPAVSPAGNRLAYTFSPSVTGISRGRLGVEEPTGGEALIRSTGREFAPSYSPDGRKVANISDQTGAEEIWLSDADGGNRTQITHLGGRASLGQPRWSPDGRTLLFSLREDVNQEVDVMPASGGAPKRLLLNAGAPSWSHDGKTIYYVSDGQVWRAAANGGDQRSLTGAHEQGLRQPEESIDGKYVYYRKWRSIWRIPSGGGDEEEFIQPAHDVIVGGPVVTARGVYYLEWIREPRKGSRPFSAGAPWLRFFDFASRDATNVLQTGGWDSGSFSISPDRKYILYPRVDENQTNLMLVEGFK